MLKIKDSLDNIVYMTIDGTIEAESVEQAAKVIEEKVLRYHNIRLYLEVRDLQGYDSIAAFFIDAKETFRYYSVFEKVAIVTDKRWLANLTDIADLFNSGEIKQFTPYEQEIAKQWITH